MTGLLNGQAVKVALVSISVTWIFGLSALTARATLVPAKPPPTTTTRGAACAMAGIGSIAAAVIAAEPRRKSRRVRGMLTVPSLLLRREPGRNRPHLVVGETLGDSAHHRAGLAAAAECVHRDHDLFGAASVDFRHRGLGR